MAKFTVRQLRDAYVAYEAEIEAETPEEAAEIAYGDNGCNIKWGEACFTNEYDNAIFVTLDADGCEIDGTQQGD